MEPTVSLNGFNKVTSLKGTVDGDTIKVTNMQIVESGGAEYLDNDLLVNGTTPSSYLTSAVGPMYYNLAPIGAFYGTYIGDDGKTHSFSTTLTGYSDLGLSLKPDTITTGGSWTWSDVQYGVTSGSGSTINDEIYGNDGTISADINSGTWTATLGPVSLDGTISGSAVSGTSTFNNISGSFSGVDGIVYDGDELLFGETVGSFAGQDGSENYGGGWYN